MKHLKTKVAALALALTVSAGAWAQSYTLLNVSYDPTRELYRAYNEEFSSWYLKQTGDEVKVNQSHGGSGTQARAVIDGAPADVVTLALAYDIDAIAEKTGKIPSGWQQQFAHNSSPYVSTIVFLVRKGNPKQIKDWDDLIRPDIKVITPNPKTSGGARWNYLAAYGYALDKYGSHEKALDYLVKLFTNVPVLDTGARGATNTFVKRKLGDVLIAWENEAYLALDKLGKDQFEIVTPSESILAEPPVAIVQAEVQKHGTEKPAKAYLEHLYSKEAQKIIAENYYRPTDPEIAKQYEDRFAKVKLFDVQRFGGWQKAQKEHFADGGTFDTVFKTIESKR